MPTPSSLVASRPWLPEKSSSVRAWSTRLREYAQSPRVRDGLAFWVNAAEGTAGRLPRDADPAINRVGVLETTAIELDAADTTALLQETPRAYRTQINDVLLTALALTLSRWTGSSVVCIDLEGHGREALFDDIDLTRTVGWFTSMFPVRLEVPGDDLGSALKAVKEQLRKIPDRGVSYGLLRYLHDDAEVRATLSALPHPDVAFNYLGQFGHTGLGSAAIKPAAESPGPMASPLEPRSHLIEINASIVGGRFRMDWSVQPAGPPSGDGRARGGGLPRDAPRSDRALPVGAGGGVHALGFLQGTGQPAGARQAAEADRPRHRESLVMNAADVEDIYELSPLQEGILFHTLYAPASGMYVEQLSFVLHDTLDAAAYERAWQAAIDRHPALRTSFDWAGDKPLQIVSRRATQPVTLEDWRALAADDREQKWQHLLHADVQRGFDLSRAPLLRMAVVRMADDEHRVVLSVHHLVLDGWSSNQLHREVALLYAAELRGAPLELPAVRPFGDYISWLQGQDLLRAETFWRAQLAGYAGATPLDLGVKPAGPAHADGPVDFREIIITTQSCEGLRGLARRHQLTLNTLLQGAWALLLSRYTGDTDIVFGATVSGRPADLDDVETMIGLFINTLPVRAHAAPEASLIPWLAGLQAAQFDAKPFEYTPRSRRFIRGATRRATVRSSRRCWPSRIFRSMPGRTRPPRRFRFDIGGVPTTRCR